MEIVLNREQRIVLLQALKDGRVKLETLKACGLAELNKFDHMTDEQLDDELVRMAGMEADDPVMVERCCKKRYEVGGGCYLADYFWKKSDKKEVYEAIREVIRKPYMKGTQ